MKKVDTDLDVVNLAKEMDGSETESILYIRIEDSQAFTCMYGIETILSDGLLTVMMRDPEFVSVMSDAMLRYQDETEACEICGSLFHNSDRCRTCEN